MSRELDGRLIVIGALLLAVATGLFARQQVLVSSSVHVAGRVAGLSCASAGTSCHPLVEYATPDGELHVVHGVSDGSATTFEVDGEWMPVLYSPTAPNDGTVIDDVPPLTSAAVLLALVGSIALGLGSAGRVEAPADGERAGAWLLRGGSLIVGLSGCVAAYAFVGARYVEASTIVPMALIALAFTVPVTIRLGQASYPLHSWIALVAYGLPILALVAWLGLLAYPASLRGGVLACAPFMLVVTLPLQARLWPTMELWSARRRERARRRARLERAITAPAESGEMIVRVESYDTSTRIAQLVRRDSSGDTPIEASMDAFSGTLVDDGLWFLLVEPMTAPRVTAASSGYREAAHEEWLVGARQTEPLGPSLEVALRGESGDSTPAWTYTIPLFVCAIGAALGGYLVADHTPPLSGRPIPANGLVEGLDAPLSSTGHVTEVSAWPGVFVGAVCSVAVEPTHRSGQTCHVAVTCNDVDVYPGGGGGYMRCVSSATGEIVGEDTSMSDGDPALRVDTRAHTVVVRASAGVRDRSITVTLPAR